MQNSDFTSDPAPTLPDDLSFLWLELTRKCNLHCVHCYADSAPEVPLYEGMRSEDWTRVLSEAAALGCRSVQFIGGEATLHPHLDRLIEHASSEGFEFLELYTNATSLTAERLARLARYNVQLACSFYSHRPEVHDQITQRPGSFRKTVAGIERALAAGLALRCAIITMDLNREDGEEAAEFLRRLGVEDIGFDRARDVGRGSHVNGRNVTLGMEDTCGHCADGKLCVTANGETYPCIMSRCSRVGDVLDSSLAEILPSEKFDEFRQIMASRLSEELRPQSAGCQPRPKEDSCQPRPNGGACQPRPKEDSCQPRPKDDACQPRPKYDACQPRPNGDACQPRPKYDACQPRPNGDVCQPRPKDDACQPRPKSDACQPRPKSDACQPRPKGDACQPRPKYDACQPRPNGDSCQPRPTSARLSVLDRIKSFLTRLWRG